MSGERPVPLWPEALRNKLKLRPVENQRTEALTEGVFAPVAKQPELSKPGEQPVQQQGGTPPEAKVVFSGEPMSPETQSAGKHGNEVAGGSQGSGREIPAFQQTGELDFPTFEQELLLTERFGVPLENYREIAKGLFREEVDIENLTEEQKAQIEAVHLGSEEGFELGLREFFEERESRGDDTVSHSGS